MIINDISSDIIGSLNYHHEFYSSQLKNERDILVWLPPSYQSGSKRYPVIYMHDGQNLFDPRTSYSGITWDVDKTISKLIFEKKIEEVIVVGINNSKDRINEYNFYSNNGKNYSSFLINDLKSFIDENYRTKKDAANTSTIGSSMGGLFSFQLIMNFPKIFGKAACLSNSFWVNRKRVFSEPDNKNLDDLKIYIDCGTGERELIFDNMKMALILRNHGMQCGKNLLYHFEKDAHHSESYWASRLHLSLTFLFGK
ncbi:MAG: alpha/beta hydrolase-fold protein [Ignavibacteriaceae bacterium]|jgi:predicted alpha/beta superfamily hydrolase|nr:alpha/beta hydrolase-fold protein [Ignavibacteriaceae bacterium]